MLLSFNTLQFKNKSNTAELQLKIITSIQHQPEDTACEMKSTNSIDFQQTTVRPMPKCASEKPGHLCLVFVFLNPLHDSGNLMMWQVLWLQEKEYQYGGSQIVFHTHLHYS